MRFILLALVLVAAASLSSGELSAVGSTIVVNSLADPVTGDCDGSEGGDLPPSDPECPLRAAIQLANSDADRDEIHFDLPGDEPPFVISPGSPLPDVTEPVIIDGASHPMYNTTPVVQIDGSAAGPGADGLRLFGGDTRVQALSITRFAGTGIEIHNGFTFIFGNYIGLDTTGATAAGNRLGVLMSEDGGYVIENVISGNTEDGVVAEGRFNSIAGNFIGTDNAGAGALPNGRHGIFVDPGAFHTQIGSDFPGERNVISGNRGSGIEVRDSFDTFVVANLIGTDVTGTAAIGNDVGIEIHGDNDRVTIGSGQSGGRNVISGNRVGVSLKGGGARVIGNYIGTDITGNNGLGNEEQGVYVSGESNVVGGTDQGERNVISGNDAEGVLLENEEFGNQVLGNLIGLDVDGEAAVGNGRGASVWGPGNEVIGNTVSGNRGDGLNLDGDTHGVVIAGNRVGTNQTGDGEVPNLGHGISATAFGVRIGGNADNDRNLISGNAESGINLFGGEDVLVQGNYIGTDYSGEQRIANGEEGVFLLGQDIDVTGNVVSGNWTYGIVATSFGPPGIRLAGNKIGTDKDGLTSIPNEHGGVQVSGPGNQIGGTNAGEGNLISGNYNEGIDLIGAESTTLLGNKIGTDVSGVVSLRNRGHGVVARFGGDNRIGGTGLGERNIIAYNEDSGVYGEPIEIRANSIHSNGRFGIENVEDGPAPPVILAAGSASGTACPGCTIDVFSDDEEQGRIYHGSTVADVAGNWLFPATVIGPNITATTTQLNEFTNEYETSEFSAPFSCPSCALPVGGTVELTASANSGSRPEVLVAALVAIAISAALIAGPRLRR